MHYKTFDVLQSKKIRQWLKYYSNWPTYPQVFVEGKFIGGSDIVCELIAKEEFLDIVPPDIIKSNAFERIRTALSGSSVVLFLKGTPDAPKDRFGEKAVRYLRKNGIVFSHFNVVSDPVGASPDIANKPAGRARDAEGLLWMHVIPVDICKR